MHLQLGKAGIQTYTHTCINVSVYTHPYTDSSLRQPHLIWQAVHDSPRHVNDDVMVVVKRLLCILPSLVLHLAEHVGVFCNPGVKLCWPKQVSDVLLEHVINASGARHDPNTMCQL